MKRRKIYYTPIINVIDVEDDDVMLSVSANSFSSVKDGSTNTNNHLAADWFNDNAGDI